MGGICAMDFYYMIGSPAAGIIHQQERHELGLFTKEHIRQDLIEAGLTHVDYDADGLGHGLYTARVPESGTAGTGSG